jgi:hypothetical protein
MFSIAPSHFVVVAPVVLLNWAVSFARQIVKGGNTGPRLAHSGSSLGSLLLAFRLTERRPCSNSQSATCSG